MIKKIKLPYVDIDIECTGKILLMVIGGRKPEPSWLKSLSFFDEIWAVDMGIETCREACVIPKMLIGDGDSSSPEAWEWAVEKNVPVRKFNKDKSHRRSKLLFSTISFSMPVSSAFISR